MNFEEIDISLALCSMLSNCAPCFPVGIVNLFSIGKLFQFHQETRAHKILYSTNLFYCIYLTACISFCMYACDPFSELSCMHIITLYTYSTIAICIPDMHACIYR